MNGQVEVTLRTLRTIAHTLMVHARVPEIYVHSALMYTKDHIFPVLPIKDLINKDGYTMTQYKLATGTKPLSATFTCFILSVRCTESYGARLDKDVKHASPSTKRVSRHLHGYTTASKRIPCVHTQY